MTSRIINFPVSVGNATVRSTPMSGVLASGPLHVPTELGRCLRWCRSFWGRLSSLVCLRISSRSVAVVGAAVVAGSTHSNGAFRDVGIPIQELRKSVRG